MPKKIGKLARRYARALLRSIEAERGKDGSPTPAQKLAHDLKAIAAEWEKNPELRALLLNPMFERAKRAEALLSVLRQSGVGQLEQRFFAMLFERDRISALPEIIGDFAELADSAAGLVPVEITTARQISADEVQEIEAALRQRIDGKVNFRWNVEPELLGGIVVKFHGKVLDGSLSGRLSQMERSLTF